MTYINQTDKIYAQALLELDSDKNQILKELMDIEEVFNSSKELIQILLNPTINISQRLGILEQIFKDKIDEKLYKFLIILVEKNKIDRFKEIIQCYTEQYNELNNIKDVKIISAIELEESEKQKITNALENKLNKRIQPQWDINNEIIAGLIFKIGDTIIDTSIKHKLDKLNKIMK